MQVEVVVWLVRRLPIVTALIAFVFVRQLSRAQPPKRLLRAYEEFQGYLSAKSRDSTWYQQTEEWLLKKGAAFHFGNWIQPASWLTLNLAMSFVGFIIGRELIPRGALLLAAGFYFLPRLSVQYLDYRDNERMLSELKLIYHGLEIQIRAGVYVADALAECYAGVRDERLRQALLDLAGAVTIKADVYDALNHFQCCFDNRYIDALCITLLQAMESGQAVELLSDIAEQVKDMEVSIMGRRKGALDRSLTFYQLGILAAVLGIVLYACVTQMFSVALHF